MIIQSVCYRHSSSLLLENLTIPFYLLGFNGFWQKISTKICTPFTDYHTRSFQSSSSHITAICTFQSSCFRRAAIYTFQSSSLRIYAVCTFQKIRKLLLLLTWNLCRRYYGMRSLIFHKFSRFLLFKKVLTFIM